MHMKKSHIVIYIKIVSLILVLACLHHKFLQQNEHPRTFQVNPNAVLWADALLGQPRGTPAATVAPLV